MMRKKWAEERYVQANYKTKICRLPNCRKDFMCPFYHDWTDRRREGENFSTKGCRHAFQDNTWSDPSYNCYDGDECPYAHSRVEMQYHSKKYKTQACREFAKGKDKCIRTYFCAFKHGTEYQHSAQPERPVPMTPPSMPGPSTSRAARSSHAVFGSQSYARIASLSLTSSTVVTPTLVRDTPKSTQMTPTSASDEHGGGACGPLPDSHRNRNTIPLPNGFTPLQAPVQEVSFLEAEANEEEIFRNSESASSLSDAAELPMDFFASLRISAGRGDAFYSSGHHEVPGSSRQLPPEGRLETLQRRAESENMQGRRASLQPITSAHPVRRHSGVAFPHNQNHQSEPPGRLLFGPYNQVLVLAADDPNNNARPPPPPVSLPLPSLERQCSMLPLWMGLGGCELDTWAMDENEAVEPLELLDTMETNNFSVPEAGGGGSGGCKGWPIAANGASNPFETNSEYLHEPLHRTGIWVNTTSDMHIYPPRGNGTHNPSHYYNGA